MKQQKQEKKSSQLGFITALTALFIGCLGAAFAGAAEIFIQLTETYGLLAALPALIIACVLGACSLVASIFLFGNSVAKTFNHEVDMPKGIRATLKTAFSVFFSPINAIIETSCTYAALKAAKMPTIVCVLFAIFALPLNYFFTQEEAGEVMSAQTQRNKRSRTSEQVMMSLGATAAFVFSASIATVMTLTIMALIPVPGVNIAVAAIIALGYFAAAMVSMVSTVQEIIKHDHSSVGAEKSVGFTHGFKQFIKKYSESIARVATACFASGMLVETYISINEALEKIPVIGHSKYIRAAIAGVCSVCFATVNALMALCFFRKATSEVDSIEVPEAKTTVSAKVKAAADQSEVSHTTSVVLHGRNRAQSLPSFREPPNVAQASNLTQDDRKIDYNRPHQIVYGFR